jgi:uncharacterized protein (DUF4415 family)
MPKKSDKTMMPDEDDFPEIPAELLARMTPARRGRPPQGAAAKQSIALRIDPDVLAAFKAQGPGWQSRMQATLKRAASRMAKSAGDADKPARRKKG